MIHEVIVTTKDSKDKIHIAPMGLGANGSNRYYTVDGYSGFLWRLWLLWVLSRYQF